MVSPRMLDAYVRYVVRYVYNSDLEENKITRAYGTKLKKIARRVAVRTKRGVKCKICGRVYRLSTQVSRHLKSAHLIELQEMLERELKR